MCVLLNRETRKHGGGWPAPCLFLPRLALCLVLAASLFLVAGCDSKGNAQDDYQLGAQALVARDVPEAQMHFERYLRLNPEGKRRWQTWEYLLDIALNYRGEKQVAQSYLEIMLVEYADDPERRRSIKLRLADVVSDLRKYGRAMELWEALVEDPGVPAEVRSGLYRNISREYLRRLEFTPATDMLEACVQLDIPAAVKADCMYDLAEAQTITDALPLAAVTLRALLAMEGATEQKRVLATFLLADVLEQQGKPAEALTLFESIQDTYPNSRVIAMRIAYLKGKKKR